MSEARSVSVDAARLRPTFYLELPVPAEEAIQRIRRELARTELAGPTMAAGRYAEFLVHRSERRIWSPRLTIRIEDAPDGSTLRGRFAPRPDVWTGFMFVYIVVAFLILFGATLGYVQQVSDQTPWGYWAVPGGLLVIAAIHLLSYAGQRLARGQMGELRGRLNAVLENQFDSVSTPEDR